MTTTTPAERAVYPGLDEYRLELRRLVDKAVVDVAREMLRDVVASYMPLAELARLRAEARDPFFPRDRE